MKENLISIRRFDIETFFDKMVDFVWNHGSQKEHSLRDFVWVESIGDVPIFCDGPSWDVLGGLYEEGKMVFFPFAYIDDLGIITCADGNIYHPLSLGQMFMGLGDSVGYLMQVKGSNLVVKTAIHRGGGCAGTTSQVDLCPESTLLSESMYKFICCFIDG